MDLVLNGGDKSLLLDKQDGLKAESAALSKKLDELDDQLRDMPERAETTRIAKKILLGLRTQSRRRDWRKLGHEEIRNFLRFLFGDGKQNGIFVERVGDVRWIITFKGALDGVNSDLLTTPIQQGVKPCSHSSS